MAYKRISGMPVLEGGTGLITATTAYGVVCAGTTATGAFQVINALGSAGQALTSQGAGSLPQWASILYPWTDVTGASQSMATNNGYVANRATLVTATLPSSANEGDTIRVAGKGAGGWSIAQNASQLINYGTSTTTTGITGSLSSTAQFDCVELLCITANTTFVVLSSVGNLTVV